VKLGCIDAASRNLGLGVTLGARGYDAPTVQLRFELCDVGVGVVGLHCPPGVDGEPALGHASGKDAAKLGERGCGIATGSWPKQRRKDLAAGCEIELHR
jgi:hypothetical protein